MEDVISKYIIALPIPNEYHQNLNIYHLLKNYLKNENNIQSNCNSNGCNSNIKSKYLKINKLGE